jgi:hypothetical protein
MLVHGPDEKMRVFVLDHISFKFLTKLGFPTIAVFPAPIPVEPQWPGLKIKVAGFDFRGRLSARRTTRGLRERPGPQRAALRSKQSAKMSSNAEKRA